MYCQLLKHFIQTTFHATIYALNIEDKTGLDQEARLLEYTKTLFKIYGTLLKLKQSTSHAKMLILCSLCVCCERHLSKIVCHKNVR
jgi:hypothetical protein